MRRAWPAGCDRPDPVRRRATEPGPEDRGIPTDDRAVGGRVDQQPARRHRSALRPGHIGELSIARASRGSQVVESVPDLDQNDRRAVAIEPNVGAVGWVERPAGRLESASPSAAYCKPKGELLGGEVSRFLGGRTSIETWVAIGIALDRPIAIGFSRDVAEPLARATLSPSFAWVSRRRIRVPRRSRPSFAAMAFASRAPMLRADLRFWPVISAAVLQRGLIWRLPGGPAR